MASIKGIKFKNTSTLEIEDEASRNSTTQLTTQMKDVPKKTKVENGKLYLLKDDGTKLDAGTTLPSTGGTTYDDTEIKADIKELQDNEVTVSTKATLDKIELT